MQHNHWKRILIPPCGIAACWDVFNYGYTLSPGSPRWDRVSVLCFAVLIAGLVFAPCAVLVNLIEWLRPGSHDKSAARSSFIGWSAALIILLAGFKFMELNIG